MTARRWIGRAAILGLFAFLAACSTVGGGRGGSSDYPVVKNPAPVVTGTMRPYQVRGRWYTP